MLGIFLRYKLTFTGLAFPTVGLLTVARNINFDVMDKDNLGYKYEYVVLVRLSTLLMQYTGKPKV